MLSNLVMSTKYGDLGFPVISVKESISIFSGFNINSNIDLLNNTIRLANEYDNGYRLPTYLNPNIVVYTPSLVKHILFDEYDKFDRGGMAWGRMRYLFGNSSTTCNGADWERKRNHLKHGFSKPCIEEYIKILHKDIIPPLQKRWEYYAKEGIKFNLTKEIYDITLSASLLCLLGANLNKNSRDKIRDTLSLGNIHIRNSAVVGKLYPSYSSLKFSINIAQVKSIIKKIIQDAKSLPATRSVLTHLLAKDKDTTYPVDKLSDEEVLDEIRFFLSTGQITAGSTAVWTMIEMLKYPQCAGDLISDYNKHLATGDFSISNLRDISKSRNIVKEVLRLYPPIWQTYRVANSYTELGKYKFVEGSRVTVDLLSLSRNSLFWESPNVFDPSRFDRNYNKYSYIPFGCGPQSCPASLFVPIEIIMIVGSLLDKFDVEVTNKKLHSIMPRFKCSLAADDDIKVRVFKK